MLTILITGASSGLGLAFLEYYAQTPTNHLITCDILPLPPSLTLPSTIRHTHYILDVTSTDSIQSLASSVSTTPIHLVIHSIGIRGLVDHLHTSNPGSAQDAETLQVMDSKTMLDTFHINTVGAFELFRALLPSLLLGNHQDQDPDHARTQVQTQKEQSPTPAKVIVMSSRMGSLGHNSSSPNKAGTAAGAAYAYRASKAALNAVVRSLAVDVPEVVWVLVHPGRVESALVRYKEEGAISAEESVRGLGGLIAGWGRGESGGFFDRFGGRIEW